MKTKISDIQKVVYNPPTPDGPQPPQPPSPKNPRIKPISDEPEKSKNQKDVGEDEEKDKDKPEGPKPQSDDGDDTDGDGPTGPGGDDTDGDDTDGDDTDGDGPTGPGGDDTDGDDTDGELTEEERKEIWEKLNEKQKETDFHIEDPSDVPDNIIDMGGEEGGDKFEPNKPTEAPPEQTENIRRQAREITERAEKMKREQGGTGGSGFTAAGLDKEVKVTTNWRQELRKFLQPAEKKRSTYSRLDRRLVGHGIAMPTRRTLPFPKLDVVVAVDTSYSITKPVFRTFISEIISIINSFDEVKLKLLLFHTNVYALIDIDTTNKGKKLFKKISGIQHIEVNTKQEVNNILTKVTLYEGGGTEISSIAYFLKSKLNIDSLEGLLVFTDGDNSTLNIKLPKTKNLLFLINSGGNTRIVSKYGPYKIVDVEHS